MQQQKKLGHFVVPRLLVYILESSLAETMISKGLQTTLVVVTNKIDNWILRTPIDIVSMSRMRWPYRSLISTQNLLSCDNVTLRFLVGVIMCRTYVSERIYSGVVWTRKKNNLYIIFYLAVQSYADLNSSICTVFMIWNV